MGSGGGSSGGGDSNTYIRYAPYVEDLHKEFLHIVKWHRTNTIKDSPYSDYTDISIDTAFLGRGVAITAYTGLFQDFNSYLKHVDLDATFTRIYNSTLDSQATKNAIVAEGALLSEDIVTNAYPRMMTGARDINSVMSSTFVIAKGNLEASRLRNLSKFGASLKYNLIAHANDRWKTQLDWYKNIVNVHSAILQLYYTSKLATEDFNYTMHAKNTLWPFTVLDHERAALGAMQGATNSKTVSGDNGPSDGASAIGGALSGAALGGAVGGAPGAALGGVIGGIAGFLM